MASVLPAPCRRQHNRSLGEIPLSSSEIEFYSRQDEATRRQRHLLTVRQQERHLAQQMTQRYRNNLKKLQRRKTQTQLRCAKYNLLKDMDGQKKQVETTELVNHLRQTQNEKKMVTNKCLLVKKQQQTVAAKENQEDAEAMRTVRRQQVHQNMKKCCVKLDSCQQRRRDSVRALQAKDVARRRNTVRDDFETSQQSLEEVFVASKPNDVVLDKFARTHCLSTTRSEMKRSMEKVTCYKKKQSIMVQGKDETDTKQERNRLIVKAQQKARLERGRKALNEVVFRRQGQQAMEWLASMDRMERRARGQEPRGVDEYLFDTRSVDEGMNKPEQVAERAFAQMLGLHEDSVELSVFSIISDDERSVALADLDNELLDGKETAHAESVKLEAATRNDLHTRSMFGGSVTSGKGKVSEPTIEKSLKTTAFSKLQRVELEKRKKAKDIRTRCVRLHDITLFSNARSESGGSDNENKLDMPKTRLWEGGCDENDNRTIEASHEQWSGRTDKGGHATTTSLEQREYDYGTAERPEDNDIEDKIDFSVSHSPQSCVQEEKCLQKQDLDNVAVVQSLVAKRGQHLSFDSSSSHSTNASLYEKMLSHTGEPLVTAVDQEQRSFSQCSIASSQNKLSHRDVMDNKLASNVQLSEPGVEPPVLDSSAGCLSGASSKARSIENVESNVFVESKCFIMKTAERDGFLPSVSALEDTKESVESSSGQLGGIYDRVLLADDQFITDAVGHRNAYGHRDEQAEGIFDAIEADSNASHSSDSLPQSLGRDEVNSEVHGGLLEFGRNCLSTFSGEEITTDYSVSSQVSSTRLVNASLVEGAEFLSASSYTSDAGSDRFCKQGHVFDRMSYSKLPLDEDKQGSMADSLLAPSQQSLSRLDEVANDRAKSLEQQLVNHHMMFSSECDVRSEYERKAGAESHYSSIGIDSPHFSIDPSDFRDPYCQQVHYKARRSSTLAVSVAQYSLPPSETQSSFDDSLDRLHLDHDDSFVHELVPMFPKHTLPSPPWSLGESNEACEEYDSQLMTPNMSRTLTSQHFSIYERNKHRMAYVKHQAAASDQLPANTAMQTERTCSATIVDNQAFSSSSRRQDCSKYSSSTLDSKRLNTVMKRSPARQHAVTGQIWQVKSMAVEPKRRQRSEKSPQTGGREERDVLSKPACKFGISSFGFAVQPDIAADTSWRRNGNENRRVSHSSADGQHNFPAQESSFDDDEVNKQRSGSEHSIASDASMS